MDKTDYNHKMDTLVTDKHTYELLIQGPAPSLQRKLNSNIFFMAKANMINLQTYYRLRSSVAQTPNTHATYSFFLWVAYIQTFQTLDNDTPTPNQQITTQTIRVY